MCYGQTVQDKGCLNNIDSVYGCKDYPRLLRAKRILHLPPLEPPLGEDTLDDFKATMKVRAMLLGCVISLNSAQLSDPHGF